MSFHVLLLEVTGKLALEIGLVSPASDMTHLSQNVLQSPSSESGCPSDSVTGRKDSKRIVVEERDCIFKGG